MRWDAQTARESDNDALPGLETRASMLAAWPTPDFDGASFLEVTAKSALNRVAGTGPLANAWTINPYRGCQHACVYCFARPTHEYLQLDSGRDFDSKIVVKANIVEVLERELRGARHEVKSVQLGTNTDPYQRAEGRYQLMPGILQALARHGVSVSLLTKGTLLRRDLQLISDIHRDVPVQLALSIAIFDDALQATIEPGTPTTSARLATVRAATEAGFDVGVFIMPVLPGLTDSEEHLDRACAAIAAAGASHVAGTTLHLRGSTKTWFASWLRREHPALLPMYRSLYGDQPYAREDYRALVRERIRAARSRHGLTKTTVTDGTGLPAVALPTRRARQLPSTTAPIALF